MSEQITVCIADNDEDYRRWLERELGSAGDIRIAASVSDGRQALAAVEQHRPQVLLLDPMLPGLDGVGLLRRLRDLYIPQVLPWLRSACSLGMGLCWKSGAAAEVISLPAGTVGEGLYHAKIYLETPELFAWTLVIVLISVGFEKLFMAALGALERRLTRL